MPAYTAKAQTINGLVSVCLSVCQVFVTHWPRPYSRVRFSATTRPADVSALLSDTRTLKPIFETYAHAYVRVVGVRIKLWRMGYIGG